MNKVVFLCFSSKDRIDIAESIYYHLESFGVDTWYDRKEILMGDDRNYKNFDEGVNNCEYSIIILSPNSISSVCANEEIDLIYERYKANKTYVFPVFFNICAEDVPNKYSWMKKLVYKELNKSIDSRSLCNHVACKIIYDYIANAKYKDLTSLTLQDKNSYINILSNQYMKISGTNLNAKIAFLSSGLLYFFTTYDKSLFPKVCIKFSDLLFEETKLNLKIDLRETKILEGIFIIISNIILEQYS